MELERKGNLVRFLNIDGIDDKTWWYIFFRARYLHYGFETDDQVKTCFNQHEFLPEDLSAEMILMFEKFTDNETYEQYLTKCTVNAVKRTFRATDDVYFVNYIAPDGDMLNIACYNNGPPADYDKIFDMVPDTEKYKTFDEIFNMLAKNGIIRIFGTVLEIATMPTDAQWNTIRKIIDYYHYRHHTIELKITKDNKTKQINIYNSSDRADIPKIAHELEKFLNNDGN